MHRVARWYFPMVFRSLTAYAADPKENGWGVLVVRFQKFVSFSETFSSNQHYPSWLHSLDKLLGRILHHLGKPGVRS